MELQATAYLKWNSTQTSHQVFRSSLGICPLQLPDRLYWYRLWNTAKTTADTYLSKTAIKTSKQKFKFVKTFFVSYLAVLKPTLCHWQGGSLTQLMIITTLFQVRPKVHREPRNEVCSQSFTERVSGIRTGNFSILNVTCYPTVSLSPKVY